MDVCYSCRQHALDPAALAPREAVYDDGHWRVAHAFSSLLGWLVVIARRHITSFAELTPKEAAALGPLLRALARALDETLAVEKTYVLFLAEQPGFEHLHLHVVPRAPDLPPDRRGTAVFAYLKEPEGAWVPAATMDCLADQLRPLVWAQLQPSSD